MAMKSLIYFTLFNLVFWKIENEAKSGQRSQILLCPLPKVYYTCAPSCPPKCEDLLSNITLSQCLTKPCNVGCFCPKDLYEDINGNCLTREECLTKYKCPCNQNYTRCINQCTTASCINGSIVVPRTCGISPSCISGCQCQQGLLLTPNGCCVTKEQCLNCTDPNAEFRLDSPCQPQCFKEYIANELLACQLMPVLGCYCKSGYIRNEKGICIPNRCKSCGPNKYYSTTSTRCPPECKDGLLQIAINMLCRPGCICISGYALSVTDGSCINLKDCRR